jgi:hypothetical protein
LETKRIKEFFLCTKYKISNKSLLGKNVIKRVKRFSRNLMCEVYSLNLVDVLFCIIGFQFLKFPLRVISLATTLSGCKKFLLGTDFLFPGSILYQNNTILQGLVMNQVVDLRLIPINGCVCQIFNSFSNRVVFVKSSGTYAKKKQDTRKGKLVGLKMPSKQLKLFSCDTLCVYSTVLNVLLDKCIDGK